MGLVVSLLAVEIHTRIAWRRALSPWRGKRACRSDWEVADVRRATCCIAMVIPAPRSASRRPDAGIETADRIDDRESARCPSGANCCTCPGEIRRLSVTLWQPPEIPASSLNVGRLASEARPIAPASWFHPACWIGFDSRNKSGNYRRKARRLIGSECVPVRRPSLAAPLTWHGAIKSRCGSAATEAVAPPMPAHRLITVASIDAAVSPGSTVLGQD
jgi:hypothetical protein